MQLSIENGKFMLRFPYDADLITKIKTLNCGNFNKPYKAWEFPLTGIAYGKLKRVLGLSHPEVELWLKKNKKTINLKGYKFKTPPLPHQIEALKHTMKMFNIEVK